MYLHRNFIRVDFWSTTLTTIIWLTPERLLTETLFYPLRGAMNTSRCLVNAAPWCYDDVIKVELKERKAFLAESKQVLLGATAVLEGQQTKDKMDRDDRAVSFLLCMMLSVYRRRLASLCLQDIAQLDGLIPLPAVYQWTACTDCPVLIRKWQNTGAKET